MEDLLLKCDVHPDKKVKMFCQDHSQLCCSDCVLLNHRQCTNVALISESLKKPSFNSRQLSINLQTIIDQLNMFKKELEASIQYVEVSYIEKLQEIQDMRNNLNASLDELENTTMKELDEFRTTLQKSLKKDVDNCRRLKDELQQLGEAVQSLFEKSKKDIKFIAGRKCLDKIQESETYLKKNSVKDQSLIAFHADIDIEQYLSKRSGLGRIVIMNPNQALTVKRRSKYNVKISSDTKTCNIMAICILPSGHVIVVDRNNEKIQQFDQKYNIVSHCHVSGSLRDICLITSSEVAVTVDKDVRFISVGNGQLITGSKFKLPHLADGIAHHCGALYITSGTALYHYTLTGTLVNKLFEDIGDGLRVVKCAVSLAGDRIYVTNYYQSKLLTLAMDGTLISKFTDPELQCPWGVHVTPEGHVLVCGYSSNNVIQVDHEGKKKLAKIDGVMNPFCVCVNTNIDQIAVGLYKKNKIIVMELR
ncbi:hypothetical protein DPMN_131116 [Dreissena polymorpha]|uniref:B box-type domain-containing protein n=2 Tax=Dreissena polymorpha TaxID=45954 RepID=A0A9D4K264_DREPO|nr:hypothetical protein DPMN_131116 [Dreissena polymorpha]